MAKPKPTGEARRTTRRLTSGLLAGPIHCRRCERIWKAPWLPECPPSYCIFCHWPTAEPICPGIAGEN
jgi:hypothetical protein